MATEETPTCYAEKAARVIGKKMPDAHVRFFGDGTIDIWSLTDEQFSLFRGLMKLYLDREKELTPRDRKAWVAVLEREEIRREEAEEEKKKEIEQQLREAYQGLRSSLGMEEDVPAEGVGALFDQITAVLPVVEEKLKQARENADSEEPSYAVACAEEMKAQGLGVYPLGAYQTEKVRFLDDGTVDVESLPRDYFRAYQEFMAGIRKEKRARGEELLPTDQRAWDAIESKAKNWDKVDAEEVEARRKERIREQENSRIKGIITAVAIACLVFLFLMAYR